MNKKTYILSQYANSPTLNRLLTGIETAFSEEKNIQNFYDNIFNIQTANSYGLDVWGQILNVPRQLKVSINGEEDLYTLNDRYYKLVLLTKAIANISDCTVPSLENLLSFLFTERGKVYVYDTDTMAMRYIFSFFQNIWEKAILQIDGILPKPTGVGLQIEELPSDDIFGFNGTGFQPWDTKPFIP